MNYESFNPATAVADTRTAQKARLFDPGVAGPWRGHVLGETLQGETTILAYGTDEIGGGPPLHAHPYDEVFVIVEGRARFYVGDQIVEAEAGDVVLGPKGVPHRFENIGPARLQTIDIHHGPRWYQVNL